ncbi:hypothetical protein ACIRP2_15655 [Streptomyces sp. NPDC101194]
MLLRKGMDVRHPSESVHVLARRLKDNPDFEDVLCQAAQDVVA